MKNSVSSNQKASLATISKLFKLKNKMLHLLKSEESLNLETCERQVIAHVKSIFDNNYYLFERKNKNLVNSSDKRENLSHSDQYPDFEFSYNEQLFQSLSYGENIYENIYCGDNETDGFHSTNRNSLQDISNVERVIGQEIQETENRPIDLDETALNENIVFTVGDLSGVHPKNEHALRSSGLRGTSKLLKPINQNLDSDSLSFPSKSPLNESFMNKNTKDIFNIFFLKNFCNHPKPSSQNLVEHTGDFSNRKIGDLHENITLNSTGISKTTEMGTSHLEKASLTEFDSHLKLNISNTEKNMIGKTEILEKNSYVKVRYSIEKLDEKCKNMNFPNDPTKHHLETDSSGFKLEKTTLEVKKIHGQQITVKADIHSHEMAKKTTTGDNGHFLDNLNHVQPNNVTDKFEHGKFFERFPLKPGDLSFVKSTKKHIFDNIHNESGLHHHLRIKEHDDTLNRLKLKNEGNDHHLQQERFQEDIKDHHVKSFSSINNLFKNKMNQVNNIHGQHIKETNNYNSIKHELIDKIRKSKYEVGINTSLEKNSEHDHHHDRHVRFTIPDIDNRNDHFKIETSVHHLSLKHNDHINYSSSLKHDFLYNDHHNYHFSINDNIIRNENEWHHHNQDLQTKNNILANDHHLPLKSDVLGNNYFTHHLSMKDNNFGNDDSNHQGNHHFSSERDAFTNDYHNHHFSGKDIICRGDNYDDNNSHLWSKPCTTFSNDLHHFNFLEKSNTILTNYHDHHSSGKEQLHENNHQLSAKGNNLPIGNYEIETGIMSEESKNLSHLWDNRIDHHHCCPINMKKENPSIKRKF